MGGLNGWMGRTGGIGRMGRLKGWMGRMGATSTVQAGGR
jgi:hypothetical protein